MTLVVDHLAELTGFRDRDVLDVMLVSALRDLMRPLSLGIYRVVGDAKRQHWLTRARIGEHDTAAAADPLWSELEDLPAIDACPERATCLREERLVEHASAAAGEPTRLLFPIVSEHEAAGVLEIETVAPMPEEQRRTVQGILRIYRNFQSLLDYSERDTLTGLLNRKTFDECFLRLAVEAANGLLARAQGGGRRQGTGAHVFLGVIDIDHFKRVNDTHGHLIGDEVLLLLSRQLRACFRFYDHLFRFGGEEFVVLLRCARGDVAMDIFERLRAAVAGYTFPRVGQVTVSVGISALRGGDTPSAAFERADKALYWAKQHGRNQVADFEALVQAGELADSSRASDVELF
ncbi:MAG: GGDEF domain-containing protein [Burkholderiales bacterium]|nr:GGDEF domain-containing protein [Burkholderiales bacterium]